MKNNYWNKYKSKFKNKWHFNSSNKKKKDYIYLGNFKAEYKKLFNTIKILEKKVKVRSVVLDDDKHQNSKIDDKISAFKNWGYKEEQTKFIQIFSDENPKLFEKFINFSKLSMAKSSLIKQYPGNILPWHYDTHANFKSFLKNKKFKNKKIIRYMFFLTDWDWGHYFCVGNNVVHQWKAGDVITWDPIVHHCGSNSGMSPKITLNVTGFVEKNSLHIKKLNKF